jgi:restriction system protein
MDLVALLPWWAGVLLALVSYLALHAIAIQPVTVSVNPSQIGATMTSAIWKSFASAGQYLLPLLCLGGAGLSAYRRHQRKQLVRDVNQAKTADALDGMRWQEFEMLVGEAFRQQGFQVIETGGGGADGGVDLVLSKPAQNGREKYLVQCKQWRAWKVGVEVVRELYGVMAARGAAGGFVVTSGRFTPEATRFAEGRNLTLIDGPRLQRMLREAKGSGRNAPATAPAPSSTASHASQPATAATTPFAPPQAPDCPLCAKPMLQRTAKRGAGTGNRFWGCTGFPACRGTRPFP